MVEINEGSIVIDQQDISCFTQDEMTKFRGKNMSFIFQNFHLIPNLTVQENIELVLEMNKTQAQFSTEELLKKVGLEEDHFNKYPHEFSGGQRQRIGIARAIALKPKIIICDESVSALDVSVQANLLNLLKDLQEQFSLTLLFVSHDLAVIRQMCDRVIVMKDGEALENGSNENIFEQPNHAYTRSLLDAMPKFQGLAQY